MTGMTGRQKIAAALSTAGTPSIPAVICYEGIYLRDHWPQITSCPWWYQYELQLPRQMRWLRDAVRVTGQDWFTLHPFPSRAERAHLSIEERADGVFRRNRREGTEELLSPPQIGGWPTSGALTSVYPARPAVTPDEVDAQIPAPPAGDPAEHAREGRADLASQMLQAFGGELFPLMHVSAPLWRTYNLWGFEGMMLNTVAQPELVQHACRRYLALAVYQVRLAAALGAAGIWIEDCMTDMLRPAAFAALNVPFVRALVAEIRAAGMQSIYYFCGNPQGKWDLLLDLGADALSLEESKKNFRIDIEDIVDHVRGRCAVLGNLDAIGVLQDGSEEALRAEIVRQIAAGRRNGSRFIMSLGSPVTPGTPVARVRLYCDMVHELGTPR